MSEKKPARPNSRWATGKRRDLDDAAAKKAGYPSNLREEKVVGITAQRCIIGNG